MLLTLILLIIVAIFISFLSTTEFSRKRRVDGYFVGIGLILLAFSVLTGVGMITENSDTEKRYETIKESQEAMYLKCPGINTLYEKNEYYNELKDNQRNLKRLKETNKGFFEITVTDKVEDLEVLTDEEINECVKLK